MAKHIEGLYEITKEYEQNNNVEECYHRLASLCDSIMNIDKFQFEMDQFSINEKKLFINEFIKILESDTPVVENLYKVQKEKKFPNKRICFTLKKEDVDYSLDYMMKLFLNYGYEYYGNKSLIPNLNISREKLTEKMVEETSDFRGKIRHASGTPIDKFEKCYRLFMDNFNEFISCEVDRRNQGYYNLLESLYVLYKTMNLFADFYFQTVLYLLIDNPNIPQKDRIRKMRQLAK